MIDSIDGRVVTFATEQMVLSPRGVSPLQGVVNILYQQENAKILDVKRQVSIADCFNIDHPDFDMVNQGFIRAGRQLGKTNLQIELFKFKPVKPTKSHGWYRQFEKNNGRQHLKPSKKDRK